MENNETANPWEDEQEFMRNEKLKAMWEEWDKPENKYYARMRVLREDYPVHYYCLLMRDILSISADIIAFLTKWLIRLIFFVVFIDGFVFYTNNVIAPLLDGKPLPVFLGDQTIAEKINNYVLGYKGRT